LSELHDKASRKSNSFTATNSKAEDSKNGCDALERSRFSVSAFEHTKIKKQRRRKEAVNYQVRHFDEANNPGTDPVPKQQRLRAEPPEQLDVWLLLTLEVQNQQKVPRSKVPSVS